MVAARNATGQWDLFIINAALQCNKAMCYYRNPASPQTGVVRMHVRLFGAAIAAAIVSLVTLSPSLSAPRDKPPIVRATPTVITLTAAKARATARLIRSLFPSARITIDDEANALIVTAAPTDVPAIRQVTSAIDTRNPLAKQTQAFVLHRLRANDVISRLRGIFGEARFTPVNDHSFIVAATMPDMQQIQSLVGSIDAPTATPTPANTTPSSTDAVRILLARPKDVAREVSGAVRGVRVLVAGQSVVISGAPDLVQRAKDVIAVLDASPSGTPYTAVYRIKTLDAKSVADLLQRSFPDARISVDTDINSLSVSANASEQRRIADGISQLDNIGPTASGVTAVSQGTGGAAQLYTLKYALPGQNGAASTSATELATMVSQTLAAQAPDLHVSSAPNNTQLILTGNPYSVKLARDLLAQLDVPQRLVVLDTEILEMDENTAKDLGVQFLNAVGGPFSIGSVFSEVQPTPDPNTGLAAPIKRLLPLTRTPISFAATINLAVQHGTARVLADPRITTLSGHTATIRAGDNISIQLQAGGGAGTIATTQIQTFQTGVTLDITPIVNDDGLITVALHPVVNSLTGILNGIPQISTRDTQTTVALKENETLIIGGLIQDNTQRTESRVPVLGDLPLVGRAFRNQTLNGNRNELIISVTPHVIVPGQTNVYPGPPLPAIPTPQPLPSLPPGTILPAAAPTPMPTSPRYVPVPDTTVTPPPPPLLIPSSAPKSAVPTPHGIATPGASAAPTATPPALAQLNTFTFGSPPPNNYASSGDALQIFYATFSPTVLAYGKPFNLTAVTTSNVARLSLSYNAVSLSIPQAGPGQWQGTLPFTLIGQPAPSGVISLSLIASKADGTQATIAIPVTIVPQSP